MRICLLAVVFLLPCRAPRGKPWSVQHTYAITFTRIQLVASIHHTRLTVNPRPTFGKWQSYHNFPHRGQNACHPFESSCYCRSA